MFNGKSAMGDNTERKKRRGAVWQERELWYVIDRVQEGFPHLARETIAQAVERAKHDVPRSKGRDELVQHVDKKLRKVFYFLTAGIAGTGGGVLCAGAGAIFKPDDPAKSAFSNFLVMSMSRPILFLWVQQTRAVSSVIRFSW